MAQSTKQNAQKKSGRTRRVLMVLNIVALVGLAASTAFYAYKYYDLRADVALTDEQRNERLVQEVGKVYSLPGDEKPVVAIVSDEAKFKEEYKVFTGAKKDDYLLLYEKAALAVLYRPSEKKVVATAPLTIQNNVSIALIGPDDQTAATEKKLTEQLGGQVSVTSKKVGVGSYGSTVVVDVKGDQQQIATQLAQVVGGTVGNLPEGETAPEGATFVIIVASPESQPTTEAPPQ